MLATRTQRMAETAYRSVMHRKTNGDHWEKYRSFALRFPALVHSSGLCQAAAFAQADTGAGPQVLDDVVAAMRVVCGDMRDAGGLADAARNAPTMQYMHLTRLALQAASLVKRYVEALHERQA